MLCSSSYIYLLKTIAKLSSFEKKICKIFNADSWQPLKMVAFSRHRNYKHFDSKPELAFYIWLIDHKYPFEFHPKIKFEYEFNNKIHFYKPDFLINAKYFEIKGDQFFDKNGKMICPWKYINWTNEYYYLKCAQYEAKHQCMLKNNVIILKSKEYKQYLDYICNTYGQNYLNKYKKKNS